MAELAKVRFSSGDIDWPSAAIPVRLAPDMSVFHIKAAKRGPSFADALVDMIEIAPGEWWLLAPAADRSATAARIDAVLTGGAGWMVEIGDGLTILDLGDAAHLIVSLTGLPPAALQPGRAVRTRLAGILVTLVVRDAAIWMAFECSYGRHVRTWLDKAT